LRLKWVDARADVPRPPPVGCVVDARMVTLQNELWAAVAAPAQAQRDPVSALVLAGMNDVLNSQGYTQAAWLNRIPLAARHQGRHRHLPVEPKRLQDLLDEGQMLPQYTDPQGRAQHLRDLTRRCSLDRDHSAVRAIQA